MSGCKVKMTLRELSGAIAKEEAILRMGGGDAGRQRQKRHGRLTARERIDILIDDGAHFFEMGLWAGYGMYDKWGGLPAAGVVCGIAPVSGRSCMIVANDATVKAGAMFPQSIKKVLRAQNIAYECRLPILYLVDSSGVFLPLQDEIFPDEDDFGRIFRNNSVLSAVGIPQIAAIMGNCIAGGGYLPVLCDTLLMTEGSGLYLAGPALVKAAIGQVVDSEELGGAHMHAAISGTVDLLEKDDESCLLTIRKLISMLKEEPQHHYDEEDIASGSDPDTLYDLVGADSSKPYDAHALLNVVVDAASFVEYKELYGRAVICGYGRLHGRPIGIVANQRMASTTADGKVEIGGVLYNESADKAARFVMDCNQSRLPLVFFQDVVGFMVGRDAEQSGIIRSGAKLVNAVSNSVVPKVTIIVGNSFGAGNYAMCGKAYDPTFIVAWPNAKYAVMGAEQAADTLFAVQEKAAERQGKTLDKEQADALRATLKQTYVDHMDIRYGAARGWVDAIIAPHTTRDTLKQLLDYACRAPKEHVSFRSGVIQV